MNTKKKQKQLSKLAPRLAARQVVEILAGALRENAEKGETQGSSIRQVVKCVSERTRRGERTVWRYLSAAQEFNERLSLKASKPQEKDSRCPSVSQESESEYKIEGIKIFDEGLEEDTLVIIGGFIKDIRRRMQLTLQDLFSLRTAANAYNAYVLSERDVKEYGLFVEKGSNRIPNPAIKIADDKQKLCMEILKRYGCSPYDRQRIEVLKDTEEETSPLVVAMNKRNKN